MDNTNIFVEDGTQKNVYCLFYVYDSKYYFLYTENEKDESGYVKLYLTKVGKETINTPNGISETGNMIGIEIQDNDEWKKVQESISKIVNSKKTKVDDPSIQYVPINMLVNLKVTGKKTFRLLADIVEKNFNISLDSNSSDDLNIEESIPDTTPTEQAEIINQSEEGNQLLEDNNQEMPIDNVSQEFSAVEENKTESDQIIDELNESIGVEENAQENISSFEVSGDDASELEESNDSDIIIDYRTRFFEEQEKNKKLTEEINKLNQKLNDIQEIISKN